jgi:hypothetical protein
MAAENELKLTETIAIYIYKCWAAIIKNLSVKDVSLTNLSAKATNWIKALRFEAMNQQTFFGLQNFEAMKR